MWFFELNLLVFCLIVFLSEAISKRTRARIPSAFLIGVIFMVLFIGKIIPQDFLDNTYMGYVGDICLSMLIINMGTTFDFAKIKQEWKTVVICLATSLGLIAVVGFALAPVIGRELALMSPGPITGGGAAAAMISRAVAEKGLFQYASYPWLIFMMQGLVGFPLCGWAMRKDLTTTLSHLRSGTYLKRTSTQPDASAARPALVDRIPAKYKTVAYHWGLLLAVSVVNILLNRAVFSKINLNTNITAILFGILLSHFGLLDKNGLTQSGSMSTLFLGLFASMASSFVGVDLQTLLSMLGPLAIVFAVSTLIMLLIGIIGAKACKLSRYRCIAITLNCYLGFPYNFMLCQEAIQAITSDTAEQKQLEDDLMPTMVVASLISVTLVSVLVAGFMIDFL